MPLTIRPSEEEVELYSKGIVLPIPLKGLSLCDIDGAFIDLSDFHARALNHFRERQRKDETFASCCGFCISGLLGFLDSDEDDSDKPEKRTLKMGEIVPEIYTMPNCFWQRGALSSYDDRKARVCISPRGHINTARQLASLKIVKFIEEKRELLGLEIETGDYNKNYDGLRWNVKPVYRRKVNGIVL